MADGQHGDYAPPVAVDFENVELEAQKYDAQMDARQSKKRGKAHAKGERPKIAFTGEEFGFGYQALLAYKDIVRSDEGFVPDAGRERIEHHHRNHPVEIDEAYRQPLRTREQVLSSLTLESSDLAIVPFYSPETGYDTDTLNAMSKMFSPLGVDMVSATDHYCLAVYEPQVLDIVHAAHPGSALTDIFRRQRRSWNGAPDVGVAWGKGDAPPDQGGQYRAGLNYDRATQMLLRDRVDKVFVNPDAAKRCKAKLDGLKAAGVSVEEIQNFVEPHREIARRLRDTLDTSRQTFQSFDPRTGQMTVNSMGSSAGQARPLYAVALPFEVADRSPEFTIIDDNIEDGEPPKTRFLVCQKNYDYSLFEDIYKLKVLRVDHWMKRLGSIRRTAVDRYKGAKNQGEKNKTGVRLVMQFQRGGGAKSIGMLEDYLRYFGVRYATVRLSEDSEGKRPAPLVLDIEFDLQHFRAHPLQGSVVVGFLWRAFSRTKYGVARILAAFPYGDAQLPRHGQRRWWNEGVKAFEHGVLETFEAIAILAVQFLVKNWILTAAAVAALYYWRTPVGAMLASWAGTISGVVSKLLGGA
jgi:hypothetical protein